MPKDFVPVPPLPKTQPTKVQPPVVSSENLPPSFPTTKPPVVSSGNLPDKPPKLPLFDKPPPNFFKSYKTSKPPRVEDLGSDRGADNLPPKITSPSSGRNQFSYQRGKQDSFRGNRGGINNAPMTSMRTDNVTLKPTQAEINFLNDRKQLELQKEAAAKQAAELKVKMNNFEKQQAQMEEERKKKIKFESDEVQKLKKAVANLEKENA